MSEKPTINILKFPAEDGGDYFFGFAPDGMSMQDALTLANAVIKTHNNAIMDEDGEDNSDEYTTTLAIRDELRSMGFRFEGEEFQTEETASYNHRSELSDHEQKTLAAWNARQAVNRVLVKNKP